MCLNFPDLVTMVVMSLIRSEISIMKHVVLRFNSVAFLNNYSCCIIISLSPPRDYGFIISSWFKLWNYTTNLIVTYLLSLMSKGILYYKYCTRVRNTTYTMCIVSLRKVYTLILITRYYLPLHVLDSVFTSRYTVAVHHLSIVPPKKY